MAVGTAGAVGPRAPGRARPGSRDVVLLALALAALLAWPLVSPPICTRGEAREGLVVRDIVAHGNWIIGYRDGTLASKPPFFHWIAASVARVVGTTDAVVRLPSALAAFAILATTLVVGTLIGGPATGRVAMLALAAMPYFWTSAIEARVDMTFAAAITAALAALLVRVRGGGGATSVVCALALVAAVLTKGPVGLALPSIAVVLYLAAERRLAPVVPFAIGPFAVAVVVAGAWYLAAYHVAGNGFVQVQLLHENVNRMLGLGAFHRRVAGMLRLPFAFATHLFPWNVALLAQAHRWWRGEREDATGHLLHAWWLAVLVFYSAAARTRAVYLLPAYPAIALLAARELERRGLLRIGPLVAATAVGLLVATQMGRLHAAATEPLIPFAGRLAPALEPHTQLRASAGLLENDALVLRYLLDRSIPRGPLACERDVLVIVPPRAVTRARSLGLRVRDRARDTVLLECPRADA